MQAQEAKRKQHVDGLAAAQARIAAFDIDNAELIEEVAQEALHIARDAPIKAAYDSFLAQLKSYRNQLPGTLMAGLNDAAMISTMSSIGTTRIATSPRPSTGQ